MGDYEEKLANGFMVYYDETRSDIIEAEAVEVDEEGDPFLPENEVLEIATAMWRELTEEERQEYIQAGRWLTNSMLVAYAKEQQGGGPPSSVCSVFVCVVISNFYFLFKNKKNI